MPGFLSNYDETVRVDVGNGYWIDVKKHLSHEEAEAAERALITSRFAERADKPGETSVESEIQPVDYLHEQVLASIVAWNLDDPDGSVWPIDHDPAKEKETNRPSPRRRSLARVPQVVYDRVSKVIAESNTETRAERTSFRPDDGGGAARGADDGPDDREVLAGEPVLDAARDSSGSEAVLAAPSA